jgi:hypothetical protein
VCGAHNARLSSPSPGQEDLSVRCATIHRAMNGSPIHEFSKDQKEKTGEDDNAVLIWLGDGTLSDIAPKEDWWLIKRFIQRGNSSVRML